jgi:hypothetical protein
MILEGSDPHEDRGRLVVVVVSAKARNGKGHTARRRMRKDFMRMGKGIWRTDDGKW